MIIIYDLQIKKNNEGLVLVLIVLSCGELLCGNCPTEIMELLAEGKENRRNDRDLTIIHLSRL